MAKQSMSTTSKPSHSSPPSPAITSPTHRSISLSPPLYRKLTSSQKIREPRSPSSSPKQSEKLASPPPFADGAEDLAINNYAQAITLDPANPSLRIELGGIFYQLASTVEDRDTANSYLIRAVEEFSTATQLKSDYANAWYNLAKAYELADNIELAYQAMQQAIASLDVNSPDLDLATQELSTLKAKLPSPTPSADTQTRRDTDTLTTPSPLPSPISGGPIELIPPSPTPEPTPTPSADPSI
jgi:tetratricopeptide (TPR) repeat protein